MVNSLAPCVSVFIGIFQSLPYTIRALVNLSLGLCAVHSCFRLLWGLH